MEFHTSYEKRSDLFYISSIKFLYAEKYLSFYRYDLNFQHRRNDFKNPNLKSEPAGLSRVFTPITVIKRLELKQENLSPPHEMGNIRFLESCQATKKIRIKSNYRRLYAAGDKCQSFS